MAPGSPPRHLKVAESRERRLTWLAYSALLMMGLNVGWLGPFLPQLAHAVRVPIDRAGLTVSVTAAGYLAALFAMGEFVHRSGARTALAATMVLTAIGLATMAVAPGIPVLLCGALIVGFGHGGVDIGSNALVVDLNRLRLGAALNYLHVMFGVGALLGPMVVGFAIAGRVPYGVVFGVGAGVAAA